MNKNDYASNCTGLQTQLKSYGEKIPVESRVPIGEMQISQMQSLSFHKAANPDKTVDLLVGGMHVRYWLWFKNVKIAFARI